MAATYWTLLYAGTEKSFADWGLDERTASMATAHMGIDVFTVCMAGAKVDVAPVFPFEGAVTIRKGRTKTGGVWDGASGTIEFQGKRMLAVLEGRPEYEGVIYQFGGPWYDIEQTPYQQSRYWWVGPLETDLASDLTSEVVLFQRVAGGVGSMRTNGQQVGDILQHLLDRYAVDGMAAPYQIGTIDPALNLPTYQLKDIKCSEAIEVCLKLSPDAVVYCDYTTSPTTINVRNRANLAAVNVAFADGVQHEGLNLTAREDLVARSVVLIFKAINQLNGATYEQRTVQKYPLAGPDGGLRVLVQTINLAGFSTVRVNGSLSCTAVANTLAWWGKYLPELASAKISGFSVGAMTAVDEAGAAISLATYPNVLDDGSSIASWMTLGGGAAVVGKRATITAVASYTQKDDQGRAVQVFPKKELVARVTLTNGVTGPYSSIVSMIAGEAIPVGLAQAVYTSLATLQYDGDIKLVQKEIGAVPGVGNVVNLTGGLAAWSTMKAQVQSVHKRYGRGETEIRVGPARHLSAGDLTQLFLFNRSRLIYVNPSAQVTAQLATGQNVQLGTNAPKENTQAGLEERSLHVVSSDLGSGNAQQVQHDAPNGQIVVGKFNSGGGAIAGQPIVQIKLSDLLDASSKNASFLWLAWKDTDTCVKWKAKFMMTPPELA